VHSILLEAKFRLWIQSMCDRRVYTFILEYVILTPKLKNSRVFMACTTVTWTRKIPIEHGHTAGTRPCIRSLTRTIVLFWFMLSAQRICFAWVKKFTHFVVTSNSPHSVLTDVFGIITTERFLFVWPVSSEVVKCCTARNYKLDTTGYVKFRKDKLTRDT